MATNLPTPTTPTQQFFDGYFNQTISIDPDVYQRVYSFFLNKTASDAAAKQLAQNVIALTYNNKIDPISVINDFDKAAGSSELKTLLITFFNSLRGPTSKIGYGNTKFTNQWVQRNIKA
jgi:hypothetical protein